MSRFLFLFFLLCSLSLQAAYPPKIQGSRVMTYDEVDGVDLKVWIIGESDPAVEKPAVILFFGGSWRSGSPDSLLRHARHLASKGMICLLADYRVADRNQVKMFDCVRDAKAAVAWTRAHARELGIDSKRIAAGGASAGGHLAACAALVPGFGHEEKPNALILFNPALVMAPFEGNDFGFSNRFSSSQIGGDAEEVSPIHHVTKESVPTWIAHGTNDFVVPITTAKAFQKEMMKQGNTCELFEALGQPHAFHYRDPFFSQVMFGLDTFLRALGWIGKK